MQGLCFLPAVSARKIRVSPGSCRLASKPSEGFLFHVSHPGDSKACHSCSNCSGHCWEELLPARVWSSSDSRCGMSAWNPSSSHLLPGVIVVYTGLGHAEGPITSRQFLTEKGIGKGVWGKHLCTVFSLGSCTLSGRLMIILAFLCRR